MSGRLDQASHLAAIAKVAEFAPYASALRLHLQEILESPAFKGSRRSREFLKYIVEKALDGCFEDLKERSLGVDLFGRPASYDTGEDAIVRVTASDVRRRLLQYYGEPGVNSEFRIELPAGSYLPEFRRLGSSHHEIVDSLSVLETAQDLTVIESRTGGREAQRWFRLAPYVISALALVLCVSIFLRYRTGIGSPRLILPWSVIFQPDRQTHLISCDTNITMLQEMLGTSLSLSDYANRRYVEKPEALSPDMRRIMRSLGGRDYSAATAFLDLAAALKIAGLAQSHAPHLKPKSARMLQLRDFKTDDNFILLGSPRSNPWTALFQDQLDFSFSFDAAQQQEVCRNRRPQPGELSVYVPTATGGGTGQAYAIIAFLANPDQNGHVLVLAGSNAEATEAAVQLATSQEQLGRTLRRYGIDPEGPMLHFQALLRVTAMAGSPNRFEVIACHRLS